MAKVIISSKYCKGCMLCVRFCPRKSLRPSGKLSESGVELPEFAEGAVCTGCTMCAMMCPDAAIEIIEDDTPQKKTTKSAKGGK